MKRNGSLVAVLLVAGLVGGPMTDAAARDPVYRTPGYKGTSKAPRTRPGPAPNPIVLAQTGKRPNLLVDQAGTAHVVWIEEGQIGATADVLRYCRLKRGATTCDNPPPTQSLVPPQDPRFNTDVAGPRVLAVGDDLALLTHRYPNVVEHPDGQLSDHTTYLFLSDDGGSTFSPPVIISNAEPSGEAIVFGPPDAPQIGVISDTRTGGTFFQGIPPGRYLRNQANLALPDPNRAYSGTLGLIDGRPLAAFAGLDAQTSIRAWTGQGDVNDPATWTDTDRLPGYDPDLASGPSGNFLLLRPAFGAPFEVRPLQGTRPGSPTVVSNTDDKADGRLFEDAGGLLHASWVDRTAGRLLVRRSRNGRRWTDTETLATRPDPNSGLFDHDVAATFDGGGFAVFLRGRQIVAAPFGIQSATGRPGLGGQAGGGLPADTVTSCQRIAWGRIEILSREGCFLSAVGRPGVKVSQGTIRLNGMDIVPDPGTKIMINPRARTLDTSGSVRVELRGVGNPIVLWKGPLHLKMPGIEVAEFNTGAFDVDIKGFDVKGEVDVEAAPGDAVKIPVELQLPDEFEGAITGSAVLVADNRGGLHLDSLKFGAELAEAGPLQVASFEIEYEGGEDTWEGSVEVAPRGVKVGIKGSAKFKAGEFDEGRLAVPFDFPGLPVFEGVYLTEVSGAFGVKPVFLEAGTDLGVIPLLPEGGYGDDPFVLGMENRLRVTFSPLELQLTGQGKLFNRFPIQQMRARVSGEGFADVEGKLDFDLKVASVEGDAALAFDPPRKTFGGQVAARTCVLDFCPVGFDVALSSNGIGACVGADLAAVARVVPRGFGYKWGDPIPSGVDVIFGDCNLEQYRITLRPGTDLKARGAQAPDFQIDRGTRVETLRIAGAGGPPSVVLISPSGERITPVADTGGPPPGVPVALAVPDLSTTYVALPRPAAGRWRVEAQPGSPPIAAFAQATAQPPPRVSARVTGRGAKRVLRYTATARAGLTVTFLERSSAGLRRIGRVRAARGRIHFTPVAGLGRRRTVEAVVEQDGIPRLRRTVARFTAPSARRPRRVRNLRVRRTRSGAVATWSRGAGAADYLVRVAVSSGRRELRVVRGTRLRITGPERDDAVVVTVSGRDRRARTGRAARARLGPVRPGRGRR